MSLTKNLVVAALTIALVFVAVNCQSHDLIHGIRQPGDQLVYQENIVKSSKWLQVVTVQKVFNVTNTYNITQVRASDQKSNGNGAYVSVIRGGSGYNMVELKFKSQRGHGINFRVELYARPRY